MAGTNKKVLIEVKVITSGAEKNLNNLTKETDKVAEKGKKANKSFLGLGKTLLAIGRGFVIVKSFQLLSRAITDTIKTAAEFEQTMAKVKATTRASEEDFAALEKSARDLALGTIFTATQVGELQLAYSKLGFTTQEILNATEATLALATATGEDLASAADVVGATIRGFNIDASETGRVVDVMARSFTSSALNLENFKQSMKTVAPIASAANIDLETTTALLGTLADSGLRGTRAATGLKNLMSQLTDPTSKLAQELGYTVENSEGLIKAFQDLAARNIDLAQATGLTDERSKAAFITLINGTANVESLKLALDNANGAATTMSGIVGNTLVGSFKTFQSQIEETQIAITNSKGLRDFVDAMSVVLTLMRDGMDEAVNLRAKLRSAPFIESDFKEIIQAEKNFFEERTNNNKNFQEQIQTISTEATDQEAAHILIQEKTREKRRKDNEEYLQFLESQKTLIEQQLEKTNQYYLDAISDEKSALVVEGERLRVEALGEAFSKITAQIDSFKESQKSAAAAIKELNGDVDNVYKSFRDWVGELDKINSHSGFNFFTKELNESIDAALEFNDANEEVLEKLPEVNLGIQTISLSLGDYAQALFETGEEVRAFQDAMGSMFELFDVIQMNKLMKLEQQHDAEYEMMVQAHEKESELRKIEDKDAIAKFKGTQEAKADYEKFIALQTLAFEEKQQEKRDAAREKQLEKENALAKKAFKARQNNAMADIAINTAIAIAKAPAEGLILGAPALIALISASAIAQMAAVQSQKFQPKTFQDGGTIVGDSHSDGGVPFTVAGQAGFEAEGGEYIFSRKTVDRLGTGLLDAINFGGARPMMFADGGAVSRGAIETAASQPTMSEMLMEAVEAFGSIPVVNVAQDTVDTSRLVENAASMARL